ncbi:MAG: 2OG-Fe(II) oxygenase [Vitreimonas sp.]
MANPLAGMVEAAKAGNPQALTALAHAQALGYLTPRNLTLSLDNLARAASVGWPEALRELQVLARGTGSNAAKLRAAVNIKALQKPPERRVLLESPRVRVFENFATPQECDWLITRGRDGLHPAQVYENTGATMQAHPGRSNSEADFEFESSDIVLSLIHDRIARAAAMPAEHFEVAKLLHYKPGEAFTRHSDFLKPGADMDAEIEARGQRVATFLLYLNDGYDGGETEFTEVGFKFKARKGDGLLFVNVDASGDPDPMSLHAGLPTTRGEKWVLSLWLRGKTVNAFQTPRVDHGTLPREWYSAV